MVNSLATIPTELFEYIVSFLADGDIYSLRLTGQAICWRTTQDRFRSWLPTKKRVLMTEKSLTVFARLPEQSLAASLLRHVVISGVVYNTETFEWEHGMPGDAIVYLERQLESLVRRNKELDKFYATGKHLTLLAQGLNNLARKPRNPGLCSVSLDVASFSAHTYQTLGPESCYSWEKVWRAAETAYGAFSSAMRDCTLSIEKLELFNVERCSLCLPEVNRNKFLTKETNIYQNTRSIYLSFCEELDIDLNSNEKHFDDRVAKFDGIVMLVKNAPRIERLVLHMLRIRPELDIYSEHLLRRIMNEAHLERLRELTLRGMKAIPEDLLNLLQNSNIAKLCLQRIYLVSGTWAPIFEYCTSKKAAMVRLRFDSLCEGHYYHDTSVCETPLQCTIVEPDENCFRLRSKIRFGATSGPGQPYPRNLYDRMQVRGSDVQKPIQYHHVFRKPAERLATTAWAKKWCSTDFRWGPPGHMDIMRPFQAWD